MSTLPSRIVLHVLLPAVVGGALAWGTRSGRPAGAADASRMVTLPSQGRGKASGKKSAPVVVLDSPLVDQQRFCERLQGATMEQMIELMEEAQTFSDSFRRRGAREMDLEQMARTDPLAAWAFVEKWEKGNYRNHLLSAWARVDAAGALSWAEGQGEAGAGYIKGIMVGLVPDDLEAFFTILPRLKPEQLDASQLATAFRFMASEDSARAMKLFEGIAPGKQQNAAASSLAEGWARRDTTGAYAWARAIADPAQRESALRGVFRAWAETDPQGVAAKLDELSKDSSLEDVGGESPVRAVVRAWATKDPKATAAWLKGRPRGGNDDDFKQLFVAEIIPAQDTWAATDLADMLRKSDDKLVTKKNDQYLMTFSVGNGDGDYYEEYGDFTSRNSPLGNGTIDELNQSLRLSDPAKAFDELSKQPGDASRQYVLEAVASQWVATDPKAALAKLQQTNDEWLKLGLINALSNKARETGDPAMAASVAKAFPESAGRGSDLVPGIYRRIAERDPARAQALLQSDIDATSKSGIAQVLAEQQASYDPAGAIAWAAGQKEEALQTSATKSAMATWAQADAYAASEWLTAQPAGPLREAAVLGLVRAIQQNSPEDARRWAATLTNPQEREHEQMGVMINMVYRDLQKAKQLVAGLQLSDEKKTQLGRIIQCREQNR